eukprot:TsM_000361700 transcript=TsM_000361700 gene=TsM_000361700
MNRASDFVEEICAHQFEGCGRNCIERGYLLQGDQCFLPH